MAKTDDFIQQLISGLQAQLGELKYQILLKRADIEGGDFGVKGQPDVVVVDPKGRRFIVEIKASGSKDDLPLAMVPAMHKLAPPIGRPRARQDSAIPST